MIDQIQRWGSIEGQFNTYWLSQDKNGKSASGPYLVLITEVYHNFHVLKISQVTVDYYCEI